MRLGLEIKFTLSSFQGLVRQLSDINKGTLRLARASYGALFSMLIATAHRCGDFYLGCSRCFLNQSSGPLQETVILEGFTGN